MTTRAIPGRGDGERLPAVRQARYNPGFAIGVMEMFTARLMNRLLCALAVLASQVAGLSCARAQPAAKTEKVAMSDGVKLATDVYFPAKGKPPYPTILLRTP